MDQNTDLRGMSPAEAKEYIVAHIASLNIYKRDLAKLDADIDLWKKRIDVARTSGRADLEAGVTARVAELEGKRADLAAEADGLRAEIEEMKRQLPGLAARMRSVDPDYLLAQLQLATDDVDGTKAQEKRTEENLSSLSAEAALAALKEKMGLAPKPEAAPASAAPAAQHSEVQQEGAAPAGQVPDTDGKDAPDGDGAPCT